MGQEVIGHYVIVPGIRAGYEAGFPISSPFHPAEPPLPQPATSTSSPLEPSIPSTQPAGLISSTR